MSHRTGTIVSAPLYYDGMIVTGFGGADMGVRGRVKAYSAKDGKLIWTFYTVPTPGCLPFPPCGKLYFDINICSKPSFCASAT